MTPVAHPHALLSCCLKLVGRGWGWGRGGQTSSHSVLVRAIQLALSMRKEALRPQRERQGGGGNGNRQRMGVELILIWEGGHGGVAEVEDGVRRRSMITFGTAALQTAAAVYGIPTLSIIAARDYALYVVSAARGWDGCGGWGGGWGGGWDGHMGWRMGCRVGGKIGWDGRWDGGPGFTSGF